MRAFVDSNVIINHLEGKLDLSELRSKYKLCSNAIVFSEVFIVYLKAITGKRSYELKKNPELVVEKEAFQSHFGLISTCSAEDSFR